MVGDRKMSDSVYFHMYNSNIKKQCLIQKLPLQAKYTHSTDPNFQKLMDLSKISSLDQSKDELP